VSTSQKFSIFNLKKCIFIAKKTTFSQKPGPGGLIDTGGFRCITQWVEII